MWISKLFHMAQYALIELSFMANFIKALYWTKAPTWMDRGVST